MQLGPDRRARYWVALRSIDGIGDVTCRKLADAVGGAEAVFRADGEGLSIAGASKNLIRAVRDFNRWDDVDREFERATAAGAELFCLEDPRYPIALRFTHDPPPVLYVKGTLARVDVEAIAIVGSRAASPYGLAAADSLARGLGSAGVTVVSGLALGIDAAAHRGALASGGRTIAVLGSGIDQVYPHRHRKLAEEIAASGALVSEFPVGTPPEPHHFPRRNRIVSGLSLGVVVVEATEKSGSLISARLALEQGREVLAVPGEIGLDRTRGTHRLIRQGARLVETAADILADVLPWRSREPRCDGKRGDERLSNEARRLIEAFDGTTAHVDQLIERSGLNASQTLEILLELELAGRVEQHPGMTFYKRTR
jgi:DNA processing protein